MQGPYYTLQNGCGGLGNKTDILVYNVVIASSFDSLPDAAFSRQYNGALRAPFSSYLLHGVTIQDNSGNILACGRLETKFAVQAAYKGNSVLNQLSQFLHTQVSNTSNLNFLQYNIVEDACSSNAKIYTPWIPPWLQGVMGGPYDSVPVGNLSHHEVKNSSILPEVPLIGNATVIGHTVSLQFECYLVYTVIIHNGYMFILYNRVHNGQEFYFRVSARVPNHAYNYITVVYLTRITVGIVWMGAICTHFNSTEYSTN